MFFGLWRGGVGSTICSSFIIGFLIGVIMSRAVDTGRYLWKDGVRSAEAAIGFPRDKFNEFNPGSVQRKGI